MRRAKAARTCEVKLKWNWNNSETKLFYFSFVSVSVSFHTCEPLNELFLCGRWASFHHYVSAKSRELQRRLDLGLVSDKMPNVSDTSRFRFYICVSWISSRLGLKYLESIPERLYNVYCHAERSAIAMILSSVRLSVCLSATKCTVAKRCSKCE